MIKVLEAWLVIVTLEDSYTDQSCDIGTSKKPFSKANLDKVVWLLTEIIVPLDLLLHKKVTTITYSEINNTLALV